MAATVGGPPDGGTPGGAPDGGTLGGPPDDRTRWRRERCRDEITGNRPRHDLWRVDGMSETSKI